MPFMNFPEQPPKNAEFIPAYNILVRECRKRGFGETLPIRQPGEDLLPADMTTLRAAILEGLKQYYDPAQMKVEEDDPFVSPEPNGGSGFLMVPWKYTTTARNVYEKAAAFHGVPILREHFEDLKGLLVSLLYRKFDYEVELEIDRDKMTAVMKLNRGTKGGESHNLIYDSEKRRFHDSRWEADYQAVPLAGEGDVPVYRAYYRLDSQDWELSGVFETPGELLFDVNRSPGPFSSLIESGTAEAAAWRGTCRIQPVIQVAHPFELEYGEGYRANEESDRNGVVAEAGCGGCCNLQAGKYGILNQWMHSLFGAFDLSLAISANETNLQIGHFMSVFHYAGRKYGHYNCDTRIEETPEGSGLDEENEQAEWSFCALRRPSGVLVTFSLKGWSNAVGVAGSYAMHKEGSRYLLDFRDGVRHVFDGAGPLTHCEQLGNPKAKNVPPGKFVTRSGGGTQYEFDSPTFGPVTLVTNAYGVPEHRYFNLSTRGSRSAALPDSQPGYDLIADVRTSQDFSAASGFDFAAFYPAGEAPDFGAPSSCLVTDFLNPSDQLIGKAIEISYESGEVVRGFWNREAGVLSPSELSRFERTEPEGEVFLETRTHIRYGSGGRSETVSRTRKRKIGDMEFTVAEYRRYGAGDELSAVYEYGTDPDAGSYGKLVFSRDFDGNWSRNEYDMRGRLVKTVAPFMDSQPEEPEDHHRVTTRSYAPLHPDEVTWENDFQERTVVVTELGQETARSCRLYFEGESWSVTAAAPGAAWDAPGNRVEKRFNYTEGEFSGRFRRSENSDGTSSVAVYEKLNLQVAEDGTETFDLRTTTESGHLPGHGVRSVTVADIYGRAASRRTYDIETGLLISGSDYTYDRFGRVLTETTVDGDVTETEYNCCGPRFVTRPDGSVTEYGYDVFNRMTFESSAGVTTYYSYDANDNPVRTVVTGKEGGELVATRVCDADGELVSETAADGAVTAYAYGAGYRETTDARGFTQRTDTYLDGRTRLISGTGTVETGYEYGVEGNECYTLTTGAETVRSYSDFLGRSYKQVYADGFTATTLFDGFGRVAEERNSDGLVRLRIYDEASGKQKYQVTRRLTDSGPVDWENDAVVESLSGCGERGGEVVNFSASGFRRDGEFVELARSESGRDGKTQWSWNNGRITSRSRNYLGDGEVEEVTVRFDGSTVTRHLQDGVLLREVDSVTGETVYFHDEFNRETGSDRVEDGVTRSVRDTLDAAGRVLTRTESAAGASRVYTFRYDSAGNRTLETTPEGIGTARTYNALNQVLTVSGGTYRQAYGYDSCGRMTSLTTYRDGDTPQTTGFEYDLRGRRSRKIYADGSSESWTYRGDGKVAAHVNVRGQALTYTYNRAGEVTVVNGADLRMDYDSRGRIAVLTDRSGSRTFSYDDYGKVLAETVPNLPGLLIAREYDGGERLCELRLGEFRSMSESVTYLGYGASDPCGIRRISESAGSTRLEFSVGNWADRAALNYQPLNTVFTLSGVDYDDYGRPSADPDFGSKRKKPEPYRIESAPENLFSSGRYGYDETGRLASIEAGEAVLRYAYLPGTDLVSGGSWSVGEADPFLTLSYARDGYRRLTGIGANGAPVCGYTLDGDDRRLSTALGDGSVWSYTYDTLGQLTAAARGESNSMSYAYDGIGNRLTATEDGAETEYAANQLNQYTQINSEAPAYDADGNMLTWNGWSYTWNRENRLIGAEKGSIRFEADYDYMGRRFEKKVYEDDVLTLHRKFAYDGYKLVAEFDALNDHALISAYQWQPESQGLDVPLMMTYNEVNYYYIVDGNKNVVRLVDSSGTSVADYLYGPFGQVLESSGPLSSVNPFRFSSEYHDSETGLVYYNYRYYNPSLGRWTKRDPIGENGGVNLYIFIKNGMIKTWDRNGLFDGVLGWFSQLLLKWSGFYTGCCNGKEFDRREKYCCNGKLFSKNEKYIITIYYAVEPFWKNINSPFIRHAWIEWPSGSAGFSGNPDNLGAVGHGHIAYPEENIYTDMQENSYDMYATKFIYERVEARADEYDLSIIGQNLNKVVSGDKQMQIFYDPLWGNCLEWALMVKNRGLELSRCQSH